MRRHTGFLLLIGFVAVAAGMLVDAWATKGIGPQPSPAPGDGDSDRPDPPAQAGELAPVRDPVGGADGLQQLDAETVSSTIGRVELLDGTPLSNCKLLIVDATATEWSGTTNVHAAHLPPGVLARAVTDTQGTFSAPRDALGGAPFKVLHLGDDSLPQNWSPHSPAEIGQLVHRLPAGRLVIRATDAQGEAVTRAQVQVVLHPGGTRRRTTSKRGMATIYVRQPGDFELFAYERNRRIGATVRGHVDPRSTGDLPVVLARMDRGMVAVSVTEADGTPVEPFALRFLRRDMLVRHVKSTELYQTRFVQGLPDLELEVQLDRSYSDGPVMYDVQGKAYQLVTPDPLGQTAVHFTVTRGARLAFDLSAPDASAHRYEVWRYRDEDRTDGRDGWHRLDVWQFRADSASCSIRITGQGRWFTSLLEPGEVRIQVRRMGQPDIVYDRWLSLAAGELKVQQLSD